MAEDSSWEISQPQTLDFEAPVTELQVRVAGGTVNVVGTDSPSARVEIGRVQGPPLCVRRSHGKLVVAYADLPWRGLLRWLDGKGRRRAVEVSVSVPADVRLHIGVVGASAVVSGIRGRTDVRGVSGDTTLVGLSGDVRTNTVSGGVDALGLSGALRMHSVSGDLTVMDHRGSGVETDTVSGDLVLDLHGGTQGPQVGVNTVSGDMAVRLPEASDTEVEVSTTSGALSTAFPGLSVDRRPGAARLGGTLGTGSGTLRATSVSGAIALLDRPSTDGDSHDGPVLGKDI